MMSSIVAQRLLRQMFTALREGSYNRVDVVLRRIIDTQELLLHNPNLVILMNSTHSQVNEENNEGRTALHIAAFKGDLVVEGFKKF